MKRIGMGLVGPGFIAAHHIDAVRRLGDVDIVVTDPESDHPLFGTALAKGSAQSLGPGGFGVHFPVPNAWGATGIRTRGMLRRKDVLGGTSSSRERSADCVLSSGWMASLPLQAREGF
jgi:hypothetical protein